MGLSYAWEKFHLASLALVANRPIKQRVLDAIITLHTLNHGSHLPVETSDVFQKFMQDMTKVAAVGDEGTIEATLNTMSGDELENVAEQIMSMYDDVARAYGED